MNSSFNPKEITLNKLNIFSGLNNVGKSKLIEEVTRSCKDYIMVPQINTDNKICNVLCHTSDTSLEFRKQFDAWINDFGLQYYPNEYESYENHSISSKQIFNLVSEILLSESGDTKVFDKPETHLHPKYQFILGQLIVKLIKNNVQVFIETHSSSIFNAIRIAVKNNEITKNDVGIFFLTREDGVTKIERILLDKQGECSSYPRDFLGDNVSTELFQLI